MAFVTEIDARGLGCPKPVIMAEEALARISEGSVDILVDNEASVSNLKRFASKNGLHSESLREDRHWRVKLFKDCICDAPETAKEISIEPAKDILLVVASDTLGKDEILGRTLMKGYFETMRVTKELPHTIFLLNAAVKLTTVDEELIPVMQAIEALGVEIFTCGTCLKYFNLETRLKVGHRGTTSHIVEGMKDFEKTIWIG